MKLVNNNRITLKWYNDNPPNKSGYIWNDITDENQNYSGLKKLGQLEDLEEELGTDLITLFKALKQGNIWIKTKSGDIVNSCEFSLDCNGVGYWFLSVGKGYYDIVGLMDYGKTWAVAKEELQ